MPADHVTSWDLFDTAYQTWLRWAGIPVEYDVRPYLAALARIEAVGARQLTDADLQAKATALGEKARASATTPDAGVSTSDTGLRTSDDAILNTLLPVVFAVAREAAARLLGMRPFDVQMAAGVALHQGKLAQMATGEGKTLVAVPPAVLNALAGRGVHVFTANDYLARRDAGWMGPVYRFFGLDVGFVVQGMTPDERRRAYAADVTYVTAKEAGFDFLRDHTADDPDRVVVRRPRHYVIVDEADFILIDEARVPLVIAGPAPGLDIDHRRLAALVRELRRGVDYDADEYQRTVVLTETGFRHAGKLLGGVRLDRPDQNLLLSAVHVALHAETLLKRDRDYIVRGGRVELVDEFTGRVAENRRWPHGIQPAVEAKEGVEVRPEGKILGSIPVQHFVRLYPKIAGMTATAVPAAAEFDQFFGLTTVVFPPNRLCERDDEDDVVFTHRAAKHEALLEEIARVNATGRPMLAGTASVRESEELAAMLKARGVRCRVLNARHDAREARIVAQAGRSGAVTIATNMAGRGTDIVLGGNPAGLTSEMLHQRGLNPAEVDKATYDAVFREAKARCDAEHDVVVAAGGLHIVGTERHDSRRIDNQLRGRAGRQGDPGSSRFYLSLDDDLMKRFASDRVAGLMERLGLEDDVAIESRLVSKTIESAQSRVEGFNFDIRKRVVDFDDVINKQRETIYAERDKVLHNEDLTDTVRAFLDEELDALLDQHCAGEHPDDWGMEALSVALHALGLDGPGTGEDELWEAGGREALAGHLHELADARLAAREAEVGEVDWAMVERLVLLRTIDSLWVEHLTELDDMRRGIGLRGYAQQDPLNEFKKEAFSLYDQLQALIRHQVATTIFRVQIVKQPTAPTPDEAQLAASLSAGATAMAKASHASHASHAPRAASAPATAPVRGGVVARGLPTGPAIRAMQQQVGDRAAAPARGAGPGAKLGRNDPCHCGSGLKYKKCHGR